MQDLWNTIFGITNGIVISYAILKKVYLNINILLFSISHWGALSKFALECLYQCQIFGMAFVIAFLIGDALYLFLIS